MDQRRPQNEERAHDVLAAEEFAVPVPDPGLRRRRVVLPEDPSGIAEPHDILAAEEFAMPAVRWQAAQARRARTARWSRVGAAAAVLALVRRRRRRRLTHN